MLHGRRIETQMNLNVFPCSYYSATSDKNQTTSLIFQQEVSNGIQSGLATIFINEKRVCRSTFQDHFEFIKSSNHPVGADNLITTDRAVLNCILVLFTSIIFLLRLVNPELTSVWFTVGAILYVVQLFEVYFSQTAKLVSLSTAWNDLDLFREWFFELKKCRPTLNYSFSLTEDQTAVLRELHDVRSELAAVKKAMVTSIVQGEAESQV